MKTKTDLEIIRFSNPLLEEKSEPVKEFNNGLKEFIQEMFSTMYKGKGMGLAAVQVGNLLRIFICHVPKDKARVFINPEIIETSIEQNTFEEGCLSIPEVYADVTRSAYISIQAVNEKGKPFRLDAQDMLARVIQHEIDNLEGILFLERIKKRKRERLIKSFLKKVKGL